MTNVKCQQCGAPLGPGYGVIKCNFCGHSQMAGTPPVGSFGAPPPYSPPPYGAPPGYTPPPYTPPPLQPFPPPAMPPSGSGRSAIVLAVVAAGLILPCVGSAGVWMMAAAPSPPPYTPPPPPTPGSSTPTPPRPFGSGGGPTRSTEPAPPPPARFGSRACLLADTNGDGVREIGGCVTRGDQRLRPVMVDGASGSILWEADPIPYEDKQVLCLGDRHIGVVDQEQFELIVFPASGPSGEVHRTLTDELDRFGVGEGCVSLRTEDRVTVSMSLDTGSDTHCSARPTTRPHIDEEVTTGMVDGIISMIHRPLVAENGGTRYELTTRRPGTPFLEVSASQGSRNLWTRPLRFVPVGGEAIGTLALAAAPGVVVVAGSERGRHNAGVTLIGLGAEAGLELYATPISDSWGNIRGMFYDGGHVIVADGTHLTALDPTTGTIAWTL